MVEAPVKGARSATVGTVGAKPPSEDSGGSLIRDGTLSSVRKH